jgi:hypothetical protein
MVKKLSVLFLKVLVFLFWAWLLFSWVDIVADNNTDRPVHSSYNFFMVLEGVKID